MELKLKNCCIRPWRMEDAASLQRYADNRRIWLNLRDIFPHPYTTANAEFFLELVAKEEPLATFAIATESEAVGCIGLRLGVDVHRKTAELGYWLGEPFWRKGMMTEAVAAFTAEAFRRYDLVRIFAEPFASNAASIRVLEKCGFACEGRLKANVLKDGKILDTFLYAKLGAAIPV
jgi:ribosomal-protein-alanine N-acetyltransferase